MMLYNDFEVYQGLGVPCKISHLQWNSKPNNKIIRGNLDYYMFAPLTSLGGLLERGCYASKVQINKAVY